MCLEGVKPKMGVFVRAGLIFSIIMIGIPSHGIAGPDRHDDRVGVSISNMGSAPPDQTDLRDDPDYLQYQKYCLKDHLNGTLQWNCYVTKKKLQKRMRARYRRQHSPNAIEIRLYGQYVLLQAELLLTDKQGRQVGYDRESRQVKQEIPGVAYERQADNVVEPKAIYLSRGVEGGAGGEYRLKVISTEKRAKEKQPDAYELEVLFYDTKGSLLPGSIFLREVHIAAKDVHLFIVNYSSTPDSVAEVRGLPLPKGADNYFSFRVYSPVELLITDPLGRRVGYDRIAKRRVHDIPHGIYTETDFDEDGDTRLLMLERPTDGIYQLEVIAAGAKAYDLDMRIGDIKGATMRVEKDIQEVPITTGEVHTYTLNYHSAPGSAIQIQGGPLPKK